MPQYMLLLRDEPTVFAAKPLSLSAGYSRGTLERVGR